MKGANSLTSSGGRGGWLSYIRHFDTFCAPLKKKILIFCVVKVAESAPQAKFFIFFRQIFLILGHFFHFWLKKCDKEVLLFPDFKGDHPTLLKSSLWSFRIQGNFWPPHRHNVWNFQNAHPLIYPLFLSYFLKILIYAPPGGAHSDKIYTLVII